MTQLTHAELWGHRSDHVCFPANEFDDMVFEWAKRCHADFLRRKRETYTRIGKTLGVHRSTAKRYVQEYRHRDRLGRF